jgi:hypothetical protein
VVGDGYLCTLFHIVCSMKKRYYYKFSLPLNFHYQFVLGSVSWSKPLKDIKSRLNLHLEAVFTHQLILVSIHNVRIIIKGSTIVSFSLLVVILMSLWNFAINFF